MGASRRQDHVSVRLETICSLFLGQVTKKPRNQTRKVRIPVILIHPRTFAHPLDSMSRRLTQAQDTEKEKSAKERTSDFAAVGVENDEELPPEKREPLRRQSEQRNANAAYQKGLQQRFSTFLSPGPLRDLNFVPGLFFSILSLKIRNIITRDSLTNPKEAC